MQTTRGRLEVADPAVWDLVERERRRQRTTLDLIASENTAPAAVNEALGSVFANKTAEGYPGAFPLADHGLDRGADA